MGCNSNPTYRCSSEVVECVRSISSYSWWTSSSPDYFAGASTGSTKCCSSSDGPSAEVVQRVANTGQFRDLKNFIDLTPPELDDAHSSIKPQKFVLLIKQDDMRRQFEQFRQGSMTVTEYEAKFTNLANYAPFLVAYEHEKGRDIVVDLLVLLMSNFDVIMGMDRLTSCYASVDCHSKLICFDFPGEPCLVWKGITFVTQGKIISYVKARRMINNQGLGFIAIVHDTLLEDVTIDSAPVVREFADMFTEDLPGLPSSREIEFNTDLMLGTQPISIPPYLVAPVELRELNVQLQELLDKEFIRPSVMARQFEDLHLARLRDRVQNVGVKSFAIDSEGVLRRHGRLCIPMVGDVKQLIIEEVHSSRYSIHPGATKMYQDLRELYWRKGMKYDILKHVTSCLNCQQVKYEHQKPGGVM
ncbi:uncharacterized protein LOC142178352 [Nicotiana tabacum]|uniref:Uncharacterized protein LOC142178352 n=1 Tax=Nicotiana tabacum TaxID=4097 RepID=A0AC58U2S8_TOBAC